MDSEKIQVLDGIWTTGDSMVSKGCIEGRGFKSHLGLQFFPSPYFSLQYHCCCCFFNILTLAVGWLHLDMVLMWQRDAVSEFHMC